MSKLRPVYEGGRAEEAELSQMIGKWKEKQTLEDQLDKQRAILEDLKDRQDRETREYQSDYEKWEEEYAATQDEVERAGRGGRGQIPALVLGVILALLGVICFTPLSMKTGMVSESLRLGLGIGLLVAGVLCMGAFVFFRLQKAHLVAGAEMRLRDILAGEPVQPESETSARIRQIEQEVEQDESKSRQLEETVRGFLGQFGRKNAQPEEVLGDLYRITMELPEYRSLEERKGQSLDPREMEEKKEALAQVEELLDRYQAPDTSGFASGEEGYDRDLLKLSRDADEYLRLQQQEKGYREAEDRLQEHRQRIGDYLSRMGLDPSPEGYVARTRQLREVYHQWKAAVSQLEEQQKALEEFRESLTEEEKAGLEHLAVAKEQGETTETAGAEKSRMDLLNQELEEKSTEVSTAQTEGERLRKSLETGNMEFEQILEAESELGRAEENLEELKHRNRILSMTQKYLEEAKVAFTTRYLSPVKNAFDEYYEKLSPGDGKVYELDANFDLKLREQGKLRDLNLMSSGYLDLVSLCRRFAMIKAMYPAEKPFLILDDPFVNLDEPHLKKGLQLLREISGVQGGDGEGTDSGSGEGEYQILYLTCHESRMP